MIMAVALGCGGASTEAPAPAEETVVEAPAEEAVVVARHDLIYVCNCGPDCDCGAVASKPGKCGCGSDLVEARMLMVDGSIASLCACGPDCKCEIGDDPNTCGCGNEMKKVDLAGTGLYYCNCGGSCKCNHVSAEPGKCGCGMDLITS
jgi:hypothetical protein